MIYKVVRMVEFTNYENALIQFSKKCPSKYSKLQYPFVWTQRHLLRTKEDIIRAVFSVVTAIRSNPILSWFIAIYHYIIRYLFRKMHTSISYRKCVEFMYLIEAFTIIWHLIVFSNNLITCEDLKDFQKNSKYVHMRI